MSRTFAVGPARPEETDDLAAIGAWAFTQSSADMLPWFDRIGVDNVRVIREDGRPVGMLGIDWMGQWFGGVPVPSAGIGAVAVAADRRGHGAATRLMQAVLREVRERGVPLSTLYPATQPLYRAVGYELAGTRFEVALPAHSIGIRDRELELRHATEHDRPLMAELYQRRARWSPGNLDRSPYTWGRLFHPRGDAPLSFLVVGSEGPEGYVVIMKRPPGSIPSDFLVQDVVATTPAAARRLLSFFADHQSVAKDIIWHGPPHDPLLTHLREQAYTVRAKFLWMVRVVDVVAALERRGYSAAVSGELHLRVKDELLPENDGDFLLHVQGGTGRVVRGGRGTFHIHIRGLAPLYTGFQAPGAVHLAGFLEASEREMHLAEALFAGPAPWMSDMF